MASLLSYAFPFIFFKHGNTSEFSEFVVRLHQGAYILKTNAVDYHRIGARRVCLVPADAMHLELL